MAHERLFYAMGQGHSFVHWLDETVVGWANPEETDVAGRAHHTWALHSLHAALAITIVYLLFVYAALSIKADEEAASPKGSASPKSKPKPKSVVEKFRSGPALFVAMAIYNATQVALCVWMVASMLVEVRDRGFSAACNAYDRDALGVARVLHVFYLSKVLDFADTVFMVIKGNWRQLNFLHVYQDRKSVV
jgi:elongation of very long chain fatty acids protein 4